MTEHAFHTPQLIRADVDERIAAAQRLRTVRRLRPSRRHALAQSLHRFAERLDG